MHSPRGYATVEFALVLPLLIFLVAAAADYGKLMRAAIAVSDAARAGAEFGSLKPANAGNLPGMRGAALAAAPDIPGLDARAVQTCKCSDGTEVKCAGGTCLNGPVRAYVKVTAWTTVAPLLRFPNLPFNGSVAATAWMRAQ